MTLDLVTGATGLVGGNLVRTLIEHERQVRVLVRKSSNTAYLDGLPNVEFFEGDITDVASLNRAFVGVENVYHCAALVSFWDRMADRVWEANVVGTQNVVQAGITNAIRRLIFCSSVDALGLPEDGKPSAEEAPWNWDRLGLENPYPRTKYESQKVVLAAAGKEIDAVVVNPAFMFGEYDQHPSSGKMILEVASGKAKVYTPGGNNFVDVKDVTKAMVTAAEKGKCGECYILGHENLTYREIFTRIARVLNVAPPHFALPYPLARVGGWLGDQLSAMTGKESSVSTFTAKLGFVDHYFDSQKAVSELGMPQSPIDDVIERTVRWFRKEGMLRS
ncbi:MAG: SDR family oxidoreductase [Chloroflexi bacterium]|nr:SDR family oxidoreductase [Chloroflexota bacterium]